MKIMEFIWVFQIHFNHRREFLSISPILLNSSTLRLGVVESLPMNTNHSHLDTAKILKVLQDSIPRDTCCSLLRMSSLRLKYLLLFVFQRTESSIYGGPQT